MTAMLDGKTLAIDVDGVLADLHTAWLAIYNEEYNDNLTSGRINQWDMHPFVKPECGTKIYDYLSNPDLYRRVQPISGARWGIETLRGRGAKIVFATSCTMGMTDQKAQWLVRHKFASVRRENHLPEDMFVANDKSLILADALVDDRMVNLDAFRGPMKILFDQPWNRNDKLGNGVVRMQSWSGIVRYIIQELEWKKAASYETLHVSQGDLAGSASHLPVGGGG